MKKDIRIGMQVSWSICHGKRILKGTVVGVNLGRKWDMLTVKLPNGVLITVPDYECR